SYPDCLHQNHLHRLRRRTDVIAPEFVAFWLEAAFLHLRIYGQVGNKTTIPNLSGSRLKDLVVPLPTMTEQIRIAGTLNALRSAVILREHEVTILRELKAATMANLFREGLYG